MKTVSLLLLAFSVPLAAQVKITKGADKVAIEIDGKPFSDFYVSGGVMKPYLHPLRAASGTVVTRQYPMVKDIPGEAHDHPHHRGLWYTHGDVNGLDFWAAETAKPDKKGRVALKSVGEVKGGNKSGRIVADFEWQDPNGKPLVGEHRTMTFYSDPKLRTVDFDVVFKGIEKTVWGDTKEGTFAIRLAPWLEEKMPKSPADPPRTGKMVSAEGREGEKNVWGKRSPWVDYYGHTPQGETLGVAIFDHPGNPKHPTYWHARSYGLFAANVFGEHDFYNDKSRNGSMTLEPGQTWRFRYRVVIHPGETKEAGLARLYQAYSGGK